jgi:hypothetical protein
MSHLYIASCVCVVYVLCVYVIANTFLRGAVPPVGALGDEVPHKIEIFFNL